MSLLLLWNHNPISTTIKTSSYTVPAGFYSRARPTNLETDFTIDAVIAIEKTKYNGTVSSTTVITNTSIYPLQGGVSSAATEALAVNHASNLGTTVVATIGNPHNLTDALSNRTTNATLLAFGCFIPTDAVITASASGAKYYNFDAVGVVAPDWFFVPTGTDLNGTRYVVELYAIP